MSTMLTSNMHQPQGVEHRDHGDFFTTCITDDRGNSVTLFFMSEAEMSQFWQFAATALIVDPKTGAPR